MAQPELSFSDLVRNDKHLGDLIEGLMDEKGYEINTYAVEYQALCLLAHESGIEVKENGKLISRERLENILATKGIILKLNKTFKGAVKRVGYEQMPEIVPPMGEILASDTAEYIPGSKFHFSQKAVDQFLGLQAAGRIIGWVKLGDEEMPRGTASENVGRMQVALVDFYNGKDFDPAVVDMAANYIDMTSLKLPKKAQEKLAEFKKDYPAVFSWKARFERAARDVSAHRNKIIAGAVTGIVIRAAFTTAAVTVFGSTVPMLAIAAGAGLVVGVAVSGVKEVMQTGYNKDFRTDDKLKHMASAFVKGVKNNGAKGAIYGLVGGVIGYELADIVSQVFAAQPANVPSASVQTTPVIEAANASNQTASGAMPNLSNLRLPNGSLLNDFMNNSSAPNGSSAQQVLTTAPVETSAPAPAALTPVPPVVEAPATPSAPTQAIQSHLEIKGKETGWYLKPTPSIVNGEHIVTKEFVRLENGAIKGGETVVEGMKIDTSIEGGHAYSKFVVDSKGNPVDLNNACARAQAFYVGTNGWSFDAIKQTLGQKYNFLNYYNPNYSGDLAGKMHFNGKVHNITEKICGMMDWSRAYLTGHKADMTGYLGDNFVAHFNGSAVDLANCEPCRTAYSGLISTCNTKVCAIA